MTDLPETVRTLLAYRQSISAEHQSLVAGNLQVRWDLMADAVRGPLVWKTIARHMGPQALRMNLNTLERHDVFRTAQGQPDQTMIDYVVKRLSSAQEIQRARQFPYQYFAAYLNASDRVPSAIKSALHTAAELACGNVPQLPGPIVIGLDTSGSMSMPISGRRGRGATTKMRCVDVAALFAAAILRRNPDSVVIPFDTKAYKARVDPGDTILSLAKRLSDYGGGGTDCSLPLKEANKLDRRFAGIVLVSDNESWVGSGQYGSTGVMTQWNKFVSTQKSVARRQSESQFVAPKLINIDIQPYQTSQVVEREDILNVGGFSDAVFQVVSGFLSNAPGRFLGEIEAVEL